MKLESQYDEEEEEDEARRKGDFAGPRDLAERERERLAGRSERASERCVVVVLFGTLSFSFSRV